ncbi:MAG: hypothetical protein K0Q80_2218 [Microvirga sp.]|nr:hypothetical protein [Microvirga sp.]
MRTVTGTIEETAHADLRQEDVEVTRVPVDKVVDTAPQIRTEGDVMIVPVLEEVLVVEKRLVLKEELHIRRRVSAETVELPITLRKQRAIVEREVSDSAAIDEEEQSLKLTVLPRVDQPQQRAMVRSVECVVCSMSTGWRPRGFSCCWLPFGPQITGWRGSC